MGEREIVREREKEPEFRPDPYYESIIKRWKGEQNLAKTGKVVIRWKEQPWHTSRQGMAKYFVYPEIPGTALWDWSVFVHHIRSHSGCHRHQGGIALFVLEGKGYTTVNGVRHDWEEGDLILLPITPGGVAHQHFNIDDKPSRWLALIYNPWFDCMGNDMEQVEVNPEWHED